MPKIHRPSPAMIVALLALFVALSGSAVAAGIVPVAKRALSADNAKKLENKTAAQVAAIPGPASSIASLFTTKTATINLAAGAVQTGTASCDSGQRVVGGGYTSPNVVFGFDGYPNTDSSWSQLLLNGNNPPSPATATVYAICAR